MLKTVFNFFNIVILNKKIWQKKNISRIDDFNVNTLDVIQGKKEEIDKLVKSCPYIEITDNFTYEEAKKHRTSLRTCRTGLEKEEKSLHDTVKIKITAPIKNIYADFVAIVSPSEEKQQTEVKRWEEIKEAEKQEKLRLEEERKQAHRDNIELFFSTNKQLIENLTYQDSKNFQLQYVFDESEFTPESFEEFEEVFESKKEVLLSLLSDRKKTLQDKEDIRLEQIKIQEQQAEQIRIDKIKENIDKYTSDWNEKINNLSFQNIKSTTYFFEKEQGLKCEEFQKLFGEKRAEVLKNLEAKILFLNQQEDLRIQQEENNRKLEEIQKQLINTRRQNLVSLGFDKDGCFNNFGLKIIVSEDDIITTQEEWDNFIKSISIQIQDAKSNFKTTPEPVLEIEIHNEEVVSTEQTNLQAKTDKKEFEKTIQEEVSEIILFGMFLTGKDKDTVIQMYNDFKNHNV